MALKKSPEWDAQQYLLYSWQQAFVDERIPNMVMSRHEAMDLTARACGLLGIPTPKIRFTSLRVSCRADMRNYVLEIADWGRTKPVLLHEIAHLATIKDLLRGAQPHGPEFVAVAIALFSRFLPLSLDELIETARFRGLVLDETRARGPLGTEAMPSFFPGDL